MAGMTDEQRVIDKISELFQSSPWEGIVPIEDAISNAGQCRSDLSPTDREMYDRLILEDIHPSRVTEMVEVASGRLPSRTTRRPEIAKV